MNKNADNNHMLDKKNRSQMHIFYSPREYCAVSFSSESVQILSAYGEFRDQQVS